MLFSQFPNHIPWFRATSLACRGRKVSIEQSVHFQYGATLQHNLDYLQSRFASLRCSMRRIFLPWYFGTYGRWWRCTCAFFTISFWTFQPFLRIAGHVASLETRKTKLLSTNKLGSLLNCFSRKRRTFPILVTLFAELTRINLFCSLLVFTAYIGGKTCGFWLFRTSQTFAQHYNWKQQAFRGWIPCLQPVTECQQNHATNRTLNKGKPLLTQVDQNIGKYKRQNACGLEIIEKVFRCQEWHKRMYNGLKFHYGFRIVHFHLTVLRNFSNLCACS